MITNLGQGGAQRVFFDHALMFAESHHVEEAVFDLSGGHRIYDSGCVLHQLELPRWVTALGPLGRLFGRAAVLRRLVKARQFDVVISHMDGANWVNVLSGSRARRILVVHGTVLHDYNAGPFMQWFRRRVIFPYLYNQGDCTVAVSEGICAELQNSLGVKNSITVPNFFDVEAIDALSRAAVEPEIESAFNHPLVLVASARLEAQKNIGSLLHVMSRLRDSGICVRLVILGDGSLRTQLLRQAAELGLRTYDRGNKPFEGDASNADVWFLGFLQNPFACLIRAHIFVFPSAWEGFPLALCEAMICRLPVISSDCPTGPAEILEPTVTNVAFGDKGFLVAERGILAPIPSDEDTRSAWVSAISLLVKDPSLRESLASKARLAGETLTRERGSRRWLALLEQMEQPQNEKSH